MPVTEGRIDIQPKALPTSAEASALLGVQRRIYPGGDPRAPPLLRLAREHALRPAEARRLEVAAEEVQEWTGVGPNLDLGLVALCRALALPPGSAGALFALGRTAGWVAHALEQRASPALIRPRARFVGNTAAHPPP